MAPDPGGESAPVFTWGDEPPEPLPSPSPSDAEITEALVLAVASRMGEAWEDRYTAVVRTTLACVDDDAWVEHMGRKGPTDG